jgi:integrase
VTTCGIPIEPPSGWFRYLAKLGKRRRGLTQTAYNLATFWRWLQAPKKIDSHGTDNLGPIPWKHVTDDTLLEYRAFCQARGNKDKTVNNKLSVVYRFYWWAQEQKYVINRIGNGTTETGERYPIQISRFQIRGRWSIASDILLACHEGEMLPIPTDKDIDDAFVRLAQSRDYGIRVRNVLMFNWVLTTGIRRAELVSLTREQLPGFHSVPREDGLWQIKVTGKGGKVRTVYATDDLVSETRSYWDNERKEVVGGHTVLTGPHEIFLSHTDK